MKVDTVKIRKKGGSRTMLWIGLIIIGIGFIICGIDQRPKN